MRSVFPRMEELLDNTEEKAQKCMYLRVYLQNKHWSIKIGIKFPLRNLCICIAGILSSKRRKNGFTELLKTLRSDPETLFCI